MLIPFAVKFKEYGVWLEFECEAEDHEHAIEQALNAYPDAKRLDAKPMTSAAIIEISMRLAPIEVATIERLYAVRSVWLKYLKSKQVIRPNDTLMLDKLGRCDLANQAWSKCDANTRKLLLNDPHHYVRSCATLAMRSEK